jgi:hypothetical protein
MVAPPARTAAWPRVPRARRHGRASRAHGGMSGRPARVRPQRGNSGRPGGVRPQRGNSGRTRRGTSSARQRSMGWRSSLAGVGGVRIGGPPTRRYRSGRRPRAGCGCDVDDPRAAARAGHPASIAARAPVRTRHTLAVFTGMGGAGRDAPEPGDREGAVGGGPHWAGARQGGTGGGEPLLRGGSGGDRAVAARPSTGLRRAGAPGWPVDGGLFGVRVCTAWRG